MALALPFIGSVAQAIRGVIADYSGKLTPRRAQLLDNLPDLATGPAALAQAVGTPADPPALNSSLYAALLYIYNQLVQFDLALGNQAAGAWGRVLIRPGGDGVSLRDLQGLQVILTGGPAIGWDTSAHGQIIYTTRTFAPVVAQQTLIPAASGQGYATTVLLTANLLQPVAASPGTLLMGFGNPTGIYWGVVAAASGLALAVSTGQQVPFSGGPALPFAAHWTQNGVAVYGPDGGLRAQLNASALPPVPSSIPNQPSAFGNAPQRFFLNAAAQATVVAIEYV